MRHRRRQEAATRCPVRYRTRRAQYGREEEEPWVVEDEAAVCAGVEEVVGDEGGEGEGGAAGEGGGAQGGWGVGGRVGQQGSAEEGLLHDARGDEGPQAPLAGSVS